MNEAELLSRYRSIRDQIPQSVTLIAVSKTQSAEAIEVLYRAGHRDFGENYVQELLEKAEKLKAKGCDQVRWHFIGHLQTNKVKALLSVVDTIHTVDSLKLASEISKRWDSLSRPSRLPVFLEVNVDEEESKSGVTHARLPELASGIRKLPGLILEGLMCIPSPEAAKSGESFSKMKKWARALPQGETLKLSMGMTQDFPVAIQNGSTHVRVGTAIFGSRGAGSR